MKYIFVFLFLISSAFAETQRHIVSVGTNGLGWSGFSMDFDWDKDKSGVKSHETRTSNLKLNYHYIFSSKVMLGATLDVESSSDEKKETNGDKTETDTSESEFGLSVGYNFNDELVNSWWITAALGSGSYESKENDNGVKTDFEFDYSFFAISAGKRFSLGGIGLANVSYSPSITLTSYSIGGDAEDAGLEKASSAKLEVIKFDILF